MKATKIHVGCLPALALCLHHVFHVGPSSRVTSVRQMVCTVAPEEGGLMLLTALLTIGLGLFLNFSWSAFGLKFL